MCQNRGLEIVKNKFPSVFTRRYKLVTFVKMGLAHYELMGIIAIDFARRKMIIVSN